MFSHARLPITHLLVLRLPVLAFCEIRGKASTTHSRVCLFWTLTWHTCYTNLETWYLKAPGTPRDNFMNYCLLLLFSVLRHQKIFWALNCSLQEGNIHFAGNLSVTKDKLSFQNVSSASFFWWLLFQGLPSLISLPEGAVGCMLSLSDWRENRTWCWRAALLMLHICQRAVF